MANKKNTEPGREHVAFGDTTRGLTHDSKKKDEPRGPPTSGEESPYSKPLGEFCQEKEETGA